MFNHGESGKLVKEHKGEMILLWLYSANLSTGIAQQQPSPSVLLIVRVHWYRALAIVGSLQLQLLVQPTSRGEHLLEFDLNFPIS